VPAEEKKADEPKNVVSNSTVDDEPKEAAPAQPVPKENDEKPHKIIQRSREEGVQPKKEKKKKAPVEKKPVDPLMAYQPPFKNKEKKV
jgi:hypothetical protein